MARPKTGKVRQNLNITLHPATITILEQMSQKTLVPISRLVEKAVLEMAERQQAQDRDKMQG